MTSRQGLNPIEVMPVELPPRADSRILDWFGSELPDEMHAVQRLSFILIFVKTIAAPASCVNDALPDPVVAC